MTGGYFSNLTPEERVALRAKAVAGREAAVAARKATGQQRSNYLDAGEWERLASLYQIRLPPFGEPATTGRLERFLRQIGRSTKWFCEYAGVTTLREGVSGDARSLCGIILEWHNVDRRRAARAKQGRTLSGHLLTCQEIHGGTCKVPV